MIWEQGAQAVGVAAMKNMPLHLKSTERYLERPNPMHVSNRAALGEVSGPRPVQPVSKPMRSTTKAQTEQGSVHGAGTASTKPVHFQMITSTP